MNPGFFLGFLNTLVAATIVIFAVSVGLLGYSGLKKRLADRG